MGLFNMDEGMSNSPEASASPHVSSYILLTKRLSPGKRNQGQRKVTRSNEGVL